MATNVGSIEALLTLDRSPFQRELQAAKAEAAAFESKRYTAHIDADTDRAHRGLQQVDDDAKKTEKSLGEASKGGNLLVNSLIALGPAAVPLAAVATTLGVGFVAAAGVGVLALLGIKNALKDATPLGQVFNQQIHSLTTDLHTLETTAARGVFGGLKDGVAALHGLMPALNKDVSTLSVQLGQVVSKSAVGLVTLFHQLNPLILQTGNYIVEGATKFEQWAQSGKGMQSFLDYASANLPKVGHLLGDLATTLVHITEAGAPLGPVVVQALDDIAIAINKIPLPVLTAFILALQVNRLLAMAGGVKSLGEAFTSFSGKVTGATTAIASFGAGTATLGESLGIIGIGMAAVGAAAIALHGHLPNVGVDINDLSSAGDKANKSFNDVATTLGGNVKDAFAQGGAGAQELATKAVLAAAGTTQVQSILYETGKTANDFTTAITGTNTQFDRFIESVSKSPNLKFLPASALDDLRKLRNEYIDGQISGKDFAAAADAVNKALSAPNLPTYTGSLQYLAKQFGLTAKEAANYATLAGISQDDIDKGALSNQQLANAVHLVAHAYNTANVSTNTFLDALDKFSKGTGTAVQRAQLIGATLVAAQGDSLSFAGSMNAAYVAVANLGKQVGHLAAGIVDLKTGQINYTNAAAAPLIQALDQMQSSAMNAAEGMYLHEKGTKGATVAADDAYNVFQNLTYGALVSQASQLGLTSGQAKKLADNYFGIKNSGDIKKKIEEEGGATVLDVLQDIDRILKTIAGLNPKPTVGPVNDRTTIPLSAIDQKLGLVGSRKPRPDVGMVDHVSIPLSAVDSRLGLVGSRRPHPDVGLVDHVSIPLSAVDRRLGLVGSRHPTPTADLNNRASGPLDHIDSQLGHVGGHSVSPGVNVRDNASGTLSSIDGQLSALDGRVAHTYVTTYYNAVQQSTAPAAGGKFVSAEGNIFKYYATGGLDLPNGHQATIAPAGATRVWAEPETDGEAYIPYRRDTRARSEAILAQVASDFGLRVTRAVEHYATGGIASSGGTAVGGGANDTGMWAAVLAALQVLVGEIRAMRANTDPWRQAQVSKMHERTR